MPSYRVEFDPRQPTVSANALRGTALTRLLRSPERLLVLLFGTIPVPMLGCERAEPPGSTAVPGRTEQAQRTELEPQASGSPAANTSADVGDNSAVPPSSSASLSNAGAAGQDSPPLPPHPGPWLTVLQPSTAIYSEANAERANKLGYAQSGSRLAVTGKPKPGDKCSSGWLQVVPSGFVCSNSGTLDDKDPKIKFTLRAPALDNVLPYTYARNAKNGTPLYRTIPTRAQMLEYEPYLRKDPPAAAADGNANAGGAGPTANLVRPAIAGTASKNDIAPPPATGPVPDASGRIAAPDDTRPWWQKEGAEEKLHELRLSDLQKDSDDVLALRMVKGFYVAVDRTFHWNGRTWYKTTKGLVAPADRMGQASPSDFKGVELGKEWQLPIGWLPGGREKTQTYEIDLDKKRLKVSGAAARFDALPLTARTVEISGTTYQELASGKWVKRDHLRITDPGEPPKDLGDNERWVDVDLSSQTLVVFEGKTPIYATLISSGKSSRIKDKDHSTPIGQWRIREKHLTTTMDGDGSAAGDLPYSIEDVPYVMYFFKSYAIHGAFWHRNYGAQMSHGCINLAPLDAKAVFMKTDPPLSNGWHGAWSTPTKPGSWVVVHD